MRPAVFANRTARNAANTTAGTAHHRGRDAAPGRIAAADVMVTNQMSRFIRTARAAAAASIPTSNQLTGRRRIAVTAAKAKTATAAAVQVAAVAVPNGSGADNSCTSFSGAPCVAYSQITCRSPTWNGFARVARKHAAVKAMTAA